MCVGVAVGVGELGGVSELFAGGGRVASGVGVGGVGGLMVVSVGVGATPRPLNAKPPTFRLRLVRASSRQRAGSHLGQSCRRVGQRLARSIVCRCTRRRRRGLRHWPKATSIGCRSYRACRDCWTSRLRPDRRRYWTPSIASMHKFLRIISRFGVSHGFICNNRG